MNIGEKVAYLKGLAEGLELSSDTKNGKIIKGILDILEDMAASIQTLEDETETLDDYITEIDGDLGELEKDVMRLCRHKVLPYHHHKHGHNFGMGEMFDENEDENENEDEDLDLDDLNDDGDEIESAVNDILDGDGDVEIKCPKCGEHIFIETDELLDSEYINCSECGAEIAAIDTSEMSEISGCSCGHCHANHEAEAGRENADKYEGEEGIKF